MKIPELIKIQNISSEIGRLSVFEIQKHIHFKIQRIFVLDQLYIDNIQRGFHAHKNTEQFMLCLNGQIDFFSNMPNGKEYNFKLADSDYGIYIPPHAWHYMNYKEGSIQLVCASLPYDEEDYLRTLEEYKNYYQI